MKKKMNTFTIAILGLFLNNFYSNAQSIPAELMTGNKYGTFMLIVNKKFTPESKFGIFHLNILQFDYLKNKENDIMLQDLLFYEPINHLKITGGGFYGGKPGFRPTIGMQFALKKNDFFMMVAPRVNIQPIPQYDVFSILQLEHKLNSSYGLCAAVQSLFLFDKNQNIKCSQSLRLGISIKDYQFGAALDLEQVGNDFKNSVNYGLYIKRDIF